MKSAISTRQHLVPGLLDLSEDDLQERKLDPWIVFAGAVVSIGSVALFFVLR